MALTMAGDLDKLRNENSGLQSRIDDLECENSYLNEIVDRLTLSKLELIRTTSQGLSNTFICYFF